MILTLTPAKNIIFLVATLFFGLILAITISGFSRALLAHKFGDNTAKEFGFLTLNPAAHVNFFVCLPMIFLATTLSLITKDPYLSVLVVLMFMFFSGLSWAQTIPINANYLREGLKSYANLEILNWVFDITFAWLCLIFCKRILLNIPLSPSVLTTIIYLTQHTTYILVLITCFNIYPLPFFRGFVIYEYYLPNFANFLYKSDSIILFVVFLIMWLSGIFSFVPMLIYQILQQLS